MLKRGRKTETQKAYPINRGKPFVYKMVPRAGVEPARPRTRDFKSLASTNFAIGAVKLRSREYIHPASLKQACMLLK